MRETAAEDYREWILSLKKDYVLFSVVTTENPVQNLQKVLADANQAVSGAIEVSEKELETYLKDISFITTLTEYSASTDQEKKEAANLIALSKHLLETVLPLCLKKSCGSRFGRSPDPKKGGQVVPYLGIDTPATTQFGSHYEAACYHYMTALAEGISKEQVQSFIDTANELADYYAQKGYANYMAIPIVQEFVALSVNVIYPEAL